MNDTCRIDCRKLLLDFYSAQINSHSRLMIGFAALSLTLSTIYSGMMNRSAAQSIIFGIGIFLVALALWFLLMRLLVYGLMSDAVVHLPDSEIERIGNMPENANRPATGVLSDGIYERLKRQRILILIPAIYFYHRNQQKWGFFLCLVLSFITASVVYTLVS